MSDVKDGGDIGLSQWHPAETAPVDEWLPVWGHGRLRFMRQDKQGQWRNGYGAPRPTPKLWFALPDPSDAMLKARKP